MPLRRYVFGTGTDEPLARYTGGGTTPEWLLADHQGSIIASLNSAGAVTTKNTYDEYGVPGAGNAGLFQYTGQAYLSDLSLYHYKARAYSPTLGRFLQTDPVGYSAGLNWYAYVNNDPLNLADPSGNGPEAAACLATGPAAPICIGADLAGSALVIACAATDCATKTWRAIENLIGPLVHKNDANKKPEPKKPEEKGDNPYKGKVKEPVVVVDSSGNAIPVEAGEQITSDPKGDYQQVRDENGRPTGTRMDRGGHRGQSDPAAQGPHGHRPGVTTPDGNPHLPIRRPPEVQ